MVASRLDSRFPGASSRALLARVACRFGLFARPGVRCCGGRNLCPFRVNPITGVHRVLRSALTCDSRSA